MQRSRDQVLFVRQRNAHRVVLSPLYYSTSYTLSFLTKQTKLLEKIKELCIYVVGERGICKGLFGRLGLRERKRRSWLA